MREFACWDKAVEMSIKGYQVFPLANNAKQPPKNHHGYLEATRDQETIFSWYQATPFRNLGLRLDTSNLLVVDIDLHSESNNGRQSLLTLLKAWNDFCRMILTLNVHQTVVFITSLVSLVKKFIRLTYGQALTC